jgi:hypothetical protein
MAETHINIGPIDASGTQITFHNPAVHPLPASAGKAVTATAKVPGQPNSVAHGQVSNTTVIVDNPG